VLRRVSAPCKRCVKYGMSDEATFVALFLFYLPFAAHVRTSLEPHLEPFTSCSFCPDGRPCPIPAHGTRISRSAPPLAVSLGWRSIWMVCTSARPILAAPVRDQDGEELDQKQLQVCLRKPRWRSLPGGQLVTSRFQVHGHMFTCSRRQSGLVSRCDSTRASSGGGSEVSLRRSWTSASCQF
jgi:hypothetical protein